MPVTSFAFFAFFGVSLLIYYLLPVKIRWMSLLPSSLVFFLWASPSVWTLVYLAAAVAAVWLCARGISKALASGSQKRAKALLLLGMAVPLGLLILLKYLGFFASNASLLFGIPLHVPELAAPMGISFYSLSLLGYLLDAYWGQCQAERNPARLALYTAWYPVLVSGPILRYSSVGEQLFTPHRFDSRGFCFGLQRMLWGLFLKLVLSGRLGAAVDAIYGDPTQYSGPYIWLAAGLFMLQLYTDFSGCMEIILGVSECYGIVLPENFRTPFFSRSVQEYWQRWHITLGGWLRDYLLYPILRSRLWRRMTKFIRGKFGKKAAKRIPNDLGMLCVWLLIGLWHGGGWRYILGMGLWFWCCIVLSRLIDAPCKRLCVRLHIPVKSLIWHIVQSLRVFALVAVGNMFFRLESLRTVFEVFRLGFRPVEGNVLTGILTLLGGPADWILLGVGLTLLLLVSILQQKASVRAQIAQWPLPLRWAIWLTLMAVILLMGTYGPLYNAQDFIYERF